MTLINHPNLEPCRFENGREGYYLEEPWAYTWTLEQGDLVYERQLRFPVRFPSDGASVPRLLWSITGIRPDGLIRAAALVHDGLYRWKGIVPHGYLFEKLIASDLSGWAEVSVEERNYTRQTADKMFARIMREAEVEPFRRRMAYRGVRAFGWYPWMRNYLAPVIATPLKV